MKNALIVFVKNPVLGKVKTRLAKTMGDEKALAIYQKLLQYTSSISKKLNADKFVFYSDAIIYSSEWQHFEPRLQIGDDLGEKMENAFSHLFNESVYEKVVIIGSDCIELTTAIIENAFTQLSSYDVVIGPATDGGYYLLGMKALHASLFQNKSWSTDKVLQQTQITLAEERLSYFLLPTLNDIDEEKDLQGTLLREK